MRASLDEPHLLALQVVALLPLGRQGYFSLLYSCDGCDRREHGRVGAAS